MKKFFPAIRQTRAHTFSLRGRTPIIGRGHRARIRAESEQEGVLPEFFAHKLTDVQLTALAHLSRARVAKMRVVRPDHDLTSAAIEVGKERLNGSRHVLVAQIPGG